MTIAISILPDARKARRRAPHTFEVAKLRWRIAPEANASAAITGRYEAYSPSLQHRHNALTVGSIDLNLSVLALGASDRFQAELGVSRQVRCPWQIDQMPLLRCS
jgi:hypothetical protein